MKKLGLMAALVCLSIVSVGCNGGGAMAAGGGAAISGPPVFSAKYGTRLPRTCAKVTSRPTLEQAKALAQCAFEKENVSQKQIWLVTDIDMELGSSRDFMPGPDNYWDDIDPSEKLLPLRGQSTTWVCDEIRLSATPAWNNVGKNCMSWPKTAGGQGACWYTKFKDWQCRMTMGGATQLINQKPPAMPASY